MSWEMAGMDAQGGTLNTQHGLRTALAVHGVGGGIGDHRLTWHGTPTCALNHAAPACHELIHLTWTPFLANWDLSYPARLYVPFVAAGLSGQSSHDDRRV
jgi:hypothetical protein